METGDIIFFVGRILFAVYFLNSAYAHLFKTKDLTAYAAAKGVVAPKLAVIFTGLLLVLGSYAIIAGVRITWGVAALVLFLVPVTFQMHAFWKEEGEARDRERMNFLRNLALLGATLMLLSIPTPWPLSLGN